MPLLTETFEGSAGGMNLALPAQSLDDSEVRYLQDGLVDQPGITRRRGPVTAVSGPAALSYRGSGVVGVTNPAGDYIISVLNGDATHGYLSMFSSDRTSKVDYTLPQYLPAENTTTPYKLVDTKPALNGGAFIGISSSYRSDNPEQMLAYWRGGNKADYTTGTLTVSAGSTAVTGSSTVWSTNVSPGMFLFANTDDPYTGVLLGVVLSVNSNTSITLEKASPYTATAKSYTLTSVRGFAPKVMTGRLTTDTASTTVIGSSTKFISNGLNSGSWNLFRASDMAHIGKVSSVATNTSLTLTANAAYALNNEKYFALKAFGSSDYTLITTSLSHKVGFLNAVYAERQWFANLGTSVSNVERVWFSEPEDPEAVDLSVTDGNFIPIPSTTGDSEPIQALIPCANCLLVLKEDEAFAIFGSSPTTFTVRKLDGDGTLCGMSAIAYGSGALWLGKNGIWYFNGIESRNIVEDKLGRYFKETIRLFNVTENRAYGMVHRDHYFCYISDVNPTVPIIKGTVSSTPDNYTVAINLNTRAVSLMSNLNNRGYLTFPSSEGGYFWYLVNTSTIAKLCNGDDLFDSTGTDGVTCHGCTAGPDFYLESKKLAAGDSLRRKVFKEILLHYLVQGGSINLGFVTGLNNVGSSHSTNFTATTYSWDTYKNSINTWDASAQAYPTWDSIILSLFAVKRIRFEKRSQFVAFRLWQSGTGITKLVIGPYQLGFKMQRGGRV